MLVASQLSPECSECVSSDRCNLSNYWLIRIPATIIARRQKSTPSSTEKSFDRHCTGLIHLPLFGNILNSDITGEPEMDGATIFAIAIFIFHEFVFVEVY